MTVHYEYTARRARIDYEPVPHMPPKSFVRRYDVGFEWMVMEVRNTKDCQKSRLREAMPFQRFFNALIYMGQAHLRGGTASHTARSAPHARGHATRIGARYSALYIVPEPTQTYEAPCVVCRVSGSLPRLTSPDLKLATGYANSLYTCRLHVHARSLFVSRTSTRTVSSMSIVSNRISSLPSPASRARSAERSPLPQRSIHTFTDIQTLKIERLVFMATPTHTLGCHGRA